MPELVPKFAAPPKVQLDPTPSTVGFPVFEVTVTPFVVTVLPAADPDKTMPPDILKSEARPVAANVMSSCTKNGLLVLLLRVTVPEAGPFTVSVPHRAGTVDMVTV